MAIANSGWYEPAIKDYAASDAGDHLGPVTVGVLHTTESPAGSYRPGSGTNYGNFGHTNFPHFTADVQNGVFRCWQHISVRRSAKALANLSGGVETNREGVIQIEVVGRATEPFTNRTVLVEGLKALMRWIEAETDVTPTSSVTWKSYPDSYGNNGVRLPYAAWNDYKGWLGHQHVPENSHGDPGAIAITVLLSGTNSTTSNEEFTMDANTVNQMRNLLNESEGQIASAIRIAMADQTVQIVKAITGGVRNRDANGNVVDPDPGNISIADAYTRLETAVTALTAEIRATKA